MKKIFSDRFANRAACFSVNAGAFTGRIIARCTLSPDFQIFESQATGHHFLLSFNDSFIKNLKYKDFSFIQMKRFIG